MGLRNRTQQPFWRTTPTKSSNPDALYQFGIESVGKRDGKAMMATGWALCQVASLHEHQASDFLTDGYRIWRESPSFDRNQAAGFLTDLFGALCSLTPPEIPADIWNAAPEEVMPASIYYGLRCWAGNELLEVTTDPATRDQYEPLVFRSATEAPHDFVPTRSIEFAKGYAAAHGLPEPWVIVLPAPREKVLAGAPGPESPAGVAPAPQADSLRVENAPPEADSPQAGAPEQVEALQQAPEATQIRERPAPPKETPDSDMNWHPDAPEHVEESVRLVPASEAPANGSAGHGSAGQPVRPRPRPRPTPISGDRPRPTPSAAPTSALTGAPTSALTPAPAPVPASDETQAMPAPTMGPPAGAPVPGPAPTPDAAHHAPPPSSDNSSKEPASDSDAEDTGAEDTGAEDTGAEDTGAEGTGAEGTGAEGVDQRLADLRRRLQEWLESSYHGVEVEDDGWLTVPDIGPSAVQVEASLVQGGRLKVEVFTPMLIDVPLTPDLLRYVAVEGGRFHFGSMSLDVDDDEQALLQFSHSLIADSLDRDAFLAVVWLVASTVVERAPDLQQRFGGALFRELTSA